MATITQDMRYRLSLIKYAEKYRVSKAAIQYKTSKQYIYRWKRRFDGSFESHHPNQHIPSEIKLILDMRKHNPDADLVIFLVKLMQRGYSRLDETYLISQRHVKYPGNTSFFPKRFTATVSTSTKTRIAHGKNGNRLKPVLTPFAVKSCRKQETKYPL